MTYAKLNFNKTNASSQLSDYAVTSTFSKRFS